ncbi:MAG: peroxiredoxin family protein [Gemmatimonadota bacterium]
MRTTLAATPPRPARRVRGPDGLLLLLGLLAAACGSGSEPAAVEVPVGTGVGNRAPPLQGMLSSQEEFRLEPAGAARTVLVFYRSADCGLCRVQMEQLQENLAAYDRADARVVAVTLDPPEVSSRLADSAALAFPIASVDSATFRQWDALDDGRGVPQPASYIIDSTGIVLYRYIGRNAADRATDADLVAVLEVLASE